MGYFIDLHQYTLMYACLHECRCRCMRVCMNACRIQCDLVENFILFQSCSWGGAFKVPEDSNSTILLETTVLIHLYLPVLLIYSIRGLYPTLFSEFSKCLLLLSVAISILPSPVPVTQDRRILFSVYASMFRTQ